MFDLREGERFEEEYLGDIDIDLERRYRSGGIYSSVDSIDRN